MEEKEQIKQSDPANYKPKFLEKFAFGMGDFWTSIVYTAFSTYLTMFYTDVVGIKAAAVAWLLLLVRIIIAVWDLIVGVLVDRTKSKWGKARPWVLWGGALFGLSFIFLFIKPFSSPGAALTYAFISYFVVNIFYSAVNIPYGSLTSLITDNADQRTTLNIFRMTLAEVGAIILYIIAMPIINAFGNDSPMGWGILFGVIGLLTPIGYYFTFKNTKERVKPVQDLNDKKNKISVKVQFGAMLKNKYWWIITIMTLINWLYNGVAGGMNAYIAKYVLDNTYMLAILGIASALPKIIFLPMTAPIIKRFGKRNSALMGLFLVIPGSLLMLINPYSTAVVFAGIIIRMIGIVPLTAVLNPMLTDVIDYGEWKSNVRTDGLVFSAASFAMKVGMGISSAAAAWVLVFANYNGKLAHQSLTTVHTLINAYVWLPIVVIIAMMIMLLFFDLDKKQPKIIADLRARKAETK